jgi:hypothetical protein
MHRLSKSRVMKGLQCVKALWLGIHRKDLATPVTPEQQAIFDQGTEVGELARDRFPGGVLIDAPYWQPAEAVEQTRAAIEGGATVLYEPAFMHEGVLVRVDVLHRAAPGEPWHLVEVKSSTSVKEVHLPDVAIQAWVLQGCGEPLDGCHLMHVNSACTHPNLEELFTIEDVTERARVLLPELADTVARLTGIVSSDRQPDVDIGPHCKKPYDCDFADHCRAERGIPEWSVFDVRSLRGADRWEMYDEGIVDAAAVHAHLADSGYDASTKQGRSAEALATGRRFVDEAALREEMSRWDHPRVYLDFETIGGAVPRLPGTRPYATVPFQYSVHVQRSPQAPLEHFEYLHPDAGDPRPALAVELARLANEFFGAGPGAPGCVIAYNMSFERRCLDQLAQACPQWAEPLANLADRLEDPLPLLRSSVYDRAFRTSYSLKVVAPALLGEGAAYAGMQVDNGSMAGVAYAEMTADACDPARRDELRAALLDYCKHDTAVLARLVEWMEREGGLTQ